MRLGEEHLFYIVLAALAIAVIVLFIHWVFSGAVKADPWDESVTAQIEMPESEPVCHRCFAEHPDHIHFCPQCGAAVGDFNNLLPYERLFSIGEVLRNGTNLNLRRSVPLVAGYFLLSLAAFAALPILVPVYWFFLFRNFFRAEEIHQTPQ